jgi:hypothetical protein
MASIDDLRAWFERDLRFATWDENVKVDDSDPNHVDVRFYTDTNEYTVTIFTESDGQTYLDAAVKSRKARAGQTTARVRRLLPVRQSRLNERVWRRVLGGIIGLELVRVHHGAAVAQPDEGDEPGPAEEHTRVNMERSASASAAGG